MTLTKPCATRRKLELYAECFEATANRYSPTNFDGLKSDPEIADDIKTYMVALVRLRTRAHAAE
jgi:hypothetical protein